MFVLLVTFALRNRFRDYSPFFVSLRGNSIQWTHYIDQTCVVLTQYTPHEFTLKLLAEIEATDWVLVQQVTRTASGWMPKEFWNWVTQALDYCDAIQSNPTLAPQKLLFK